MVHLSEGVRDDALSLTGILSPAQNSIVSGKLNYEGNKNVECVPNRRDMVAHILLTT